MRMAVPVGGWTVCWMWDCGRRVTKYLLQYGYVLG